MPTFEETVDLVKNWGSVTIREFADLCSITYYSFSNQPLLVLVIFSNILVKVRLEY